MSTKNNKTMIEPFIIERETIMSDQQKAMVPSSDEEIENGESGKVLKDVFSILPEGSEDPNQKLYLVLFYIQDAIDNMEEEQQFKFIRGRQSVYDYIKEQLQSGVAIDCMRSLIFVDSPNIRISHRCSIFVFMSDMKVKNLIIDDTSFDINDWKYDIEDIESGDSGGKE